MQEELTGAMRPAIEKKIDRTGIIAVLVIDDEKDAVPLAKALLNGGVSAIELTLRTEAALKAGRAIKQQLPDVMLGVGTVLTVDQVKAVSDLGADFAVAPGCNPRVISEAKKQGISFAPGIMTPTDIEIALEHGCRTMKYFPAETAGGLEHLKNMAAPYLHLKPRFIPLGGCNISNARSYLESPLITAIGGSWLAKRPDIQAGRWKEIEENARAIRALIENIKTT